MEKRLFMGRTLEFKDKEALRKAMALFWEKGYEHCSLADLLERMKIGNSSFYNTFGNKKKLFLRTLELYNAELTVDLERVLASKSPIGEKIRSIFKHAIDRQHAIDVPKGCFIVNSVSADALEDKDIHWVIRNYLDQFEDTLKGAIRKAVETGELPSSVDPSHTAEILNFYLQGMMKLSLLSYSTSKLNQQTEYLMRSLGL
jgi:TetR/AcrR family transcriptional repressor of nem operon